MPRSTLAYIEKTTAGKQTAVYPALANRTRPAGPEHREEAVRLEAYNLLITKYGYPAEHIDIEYPVLIREDETPRYADIVVFDDREHKRPLIVVEAKQPGKSDGERQGQRYATILRAVYVLWTNGHDTSASVLVNRYPEDAAPLQDIPEFGGIPKYAITKLEPFKDDRQIAKAFRRCHTLIRNLSHLKPDEAFTEFLKVLLVKFRDEEKTSDYEFQIFLRGEPPAPEPANETAQRIRLLFKVAVEEDQDVATVFKRGDDIGLTNDCLAQIVGVLQKHSFTNTSVDQKGRAFETFLTGDLRQEFKEFMTPRPVVEAIVRMADPEPTDLILDPCCGSGAFLIYALAHVREKIEGGKGSARQQIQRTFSFAHDKLWGLDASAQMSSVARINMLVNEDGRAHIFHQNALLPRAKAPERIRGKSFQFIFTNPPFGTRISQPNALLEDFDITKNARGRVPKKGSFLTEVLFLERNLEWLKPGGLLFIVLPDSVLSNSTLSTQRAYIESLARLVGVVSLSPDTFGPSGAKSKTSILILEKRQSPVQAEKDSDYSVFVAHVDNVGYDFTGRAREGDQLPELVRAFGEYRAGSPISESIATIVTRAAMGPRWVAQPHLQPSGSIVTNASGMGVDTWALGDICMLLGTGKTPARKQYQNTGVHMVKVGNLTGQGIEFGSVERQYVPESFADKYPGAQLKPNDILFTASAHGPKWIGLKVDIYEGIPSHVAERAMACGELMICRPTVDQIDPYYLLLFLRSPAGYDAIQKCIRGQSGHVYGEDVGTIRVPQPSSLDATAVATAIRAVKQALSERRSAAEHARAATAAARDLFGIGEKPVIAR